MISEEDRVMILPEFLKKNTEGRMEESGMSPVEQEEFTSVIKAMSDEEKLLVIKTVPHEVLLQELSQRLSLATEILNNIRGVLDGQSAE